MVQVTPHSSFNTMQANERIFWGGAVAEAVSTTGLPCKRLRSAAKFIEQRLQAAEGIRAGDLLDLLLFAHPLPFADSHGDSDQRRTFKMVSKPIKVAHQLIEAWIAADYTEAQMKVDRVERTDLIMRYLLSAAITDIVGYAGQPQTLPSRGIPRQRRRRNRQNRQRGNRVGPKPLTDWGLNP